MARIDTEITRLTVASTPGWDPLDAGDYAGSWVAPDRTRPLAVAIAPGAMRLHALVTEADAETLRRAGGSIAVDPTDPAGRRAEVPMVSVWLAPAAVAPPLKHGQRVEVRLGAPARPALWQVGFAAARMFETPVVPAAGNGV